MSFLAPLYVAGILAVSLPILFHLIRRTPRGRQDFSSLMFLAPSPPRITRRSRLNNIVLLLLRAAALSLLAFAFARPFLRTSAAADIDRARGRRVAIMLDTSASMRRGDLWQQAVAKANEVAAALTPADDAALFLFDRTARPALTFAEWSELDPARRLAALRARLAEASPTWDSTRLGDALSAVADVLSEGDTPRDKSSASAPRQLVCITDMQDGAHIDALQAHQWPPNVVLDVKPVALKRSANAALHAASSDSSADSPDPADPDPTRLRVRVTNNPDSSREQFTLAWHTPAGPLPGVAPVNVYVPPGRSQIVRVPWPPPSASTVNSTASTRASTAQTAAPADRLVLAGDDADFDNTLYVVPPHQDTVRVAYLGDDAPDDTRTLRYYLDSALAETPRRKADLVARKSAEPLADADLAAARLVIVTTPADDARVAKLRAFAESGGDVLWVLKDLAAAGGLAALSGVDLSVEEAPKRDFALLAAVNTQHPLFAPFAESRFADFTRIHFWNHRRVTLGPAAAAPAAPGAASRLRVVASFDNGDPFLLEQSLGKGRLLVMTSGWQPSDSQLALSTKFVPLVAGLVRPDDAADVKAQYAVQDPIALPPPQGEQGHHTITTPDGRRIELAAGARTFYGADQPGIYRLARGQKPPTTEAAGDIAIAVNVSPDESRTAPVPVEELEQWGARLGTKAPPEQLAARQRQLQTLELENRQKLWRWLIVAVIGFLFAETALAGGLARRAGRQEGVPT